MQQSRVHCNLSIGHAVVCHRSPRGLLLRSEEHTSELQSQSNLVCRLLLEKKKNIPAMAAPGEPAAGAAGAAGFVVAAARALARRVVRCSVWAPGLLVCVRCAESREHRGAE